MELKLRNNAARDNMLGQLLRILSFFALDSLISYIFSNLQVQHVGSSFGYQYMAAWSIVGSYNEIGGIFTGALRTGIIVAMALAYGKEDTQEIHKVTMTTMFIMLGMMIISPVTYILGGMGYLPAMGASPYLTDYARDLIVYNTITLPFDMVRMWITALMLGAGDAKRPLLINLCYNVLQLLISMVLINMFQMSYSGVAIAQIAAALISTGLAILLLCLEKEPYKLSFRPMCFSGKVVLTLIATALPLLAINCFGFADQLAMQSTTNLFRVEDIESITQANGFCNMQTSIISMISTALMIVMAHNCGHGARMYCKKLLGYSSRIGLISCCMSMMLLIYLDRFVVSDFTNWLSLPMLAVIFGSFVSVYQAQLIAVGRSWIVLLVNLILVAVMTVCYIMIIIDGTVALALVYVPKMICYAIMTPILFCTLRFGKINKLPDEPVETTTEA